MKNALIVLFFCSLVATAQLGGVYVGGSSPVTPVSDAAFVNVSGDTMTGLLNLDSGLNIGTPPSPAATLTDIGGYVEVTDVDGNTLMLWQTNLFYVATDAQVFGRLTAGSYAASQTPVALTYAATTTISKANSNLQSLNCGTNDVVLTIAADATNVTTTIRLELYSSGSVTFSTNQIDEVGTVSLSTSAWNTVMFDSGFGRSRYGLTQIASE
jgi:hypothetical protein